MNDKPKILLAEDNVALNGILCFNLKNAGFDVSGAKHGREAAELASQQQYDCIISDQQMPQMTGIEFCEFVRHELQNQEVPFILLTAKAFELDSHQLQNDLNVTDVIEKPFSPVAVVTAVKTILTTTHSE